MCRRFISYLAGDFTYFQITVSKKNTCFFHPPVRNIFRYILTGYLLVGAGQVYRIEIYLFCQDSEGDGIV